MTLNELLTFVDATKVNAFSKANKIKWLNEIEGAVQADIFLLDPAEFEFYPEAPAQGTDYDLLVKPPHDKLYWAYLYAMIDFANGEYNRYNNSIAIFNSWWAEYSKWFANRYRPADGRCIVQGYYLSAYSLAVMHGFVGTEEEWIASLKGEKGDTGENGHSPYIGENGNWYAWDVDEESYADTGVDATGYTMSQDDADARYLKLSGGTMTGALKVIAPVDDDDAASKAYVETVVDNNKALFIAQYGTTTFEEILTAFFKGKAVCMRDGTIMAQYAGVSGYGSTLKYSFAAAAIDADTEFITGYCIYEIDADGWKDRKFYNKLKVDTIGKTDDGDTVEFDCDLDMNDYKIIGLKIPTDDYDAANKAYVDDNIPTTLAELDGDSTHRTVTDAEKTTWSGKQPALVSGTNIKTINNESLLGSGNITISGGGGTTDHTELTNRDADNQHPISAITNLSSTLSGKLDKTGGTITGNLLVNSIEAASLKVDTINHSDEWDDIQVNGNLSVAGWIEVDGTISGVDTPTSGTEAANKSYVDTAVDGKLSKSGGTMTGVLYMGGKQISNLATPTSAADAATKKYVDDNIPTTLAELDGDSSHRTVSDSEKATWGRKLDKTGGTMTGALKVIEPVDGADAASKGYVDDALKNHTGRLFYCNRALSPVAPSVATPTNFPYGAPESLNALVLDPLGDIGRVTGLGSPTPTSIEVTMLVDGAYTKTQVDALLEGKISTDMTATASGLSAGSAPTVSYDSETNVLSFGIPAGAQGAPGAAGADGHSPVVTATKSGTVTTIKVDGTAIATINDGADGQDGVDGQDGLTTSVTVNGTTHTQVDGDIDIGDLLPISGGTMTGALKVIDPVDAADAANKGYVDDNIPTELADLSGDSTHRTVTDTEKTTWNGKQNALVAGTNLKNVNGISLLGSGNLDLSGTSDVFMVSDNSSGGVDISNGVNAATVAKQSDVAFIQNDYDTYRNLFIWDNITPNQILVGTTGATVAGSGFNVSEYIKVKPNTLYTIGANRVTCEYSTNDVSGYIRQATISEIVPPNVCSLTTSATTNYIRFRVNATDESGFLFIEGGYNHDLTPENIMSRVKLGERAEQVPFCLNANLIDGLPMGNYYDENHGDTDGYYVRKSDGKLVASSGSSATYYIPIKPNTEYYVRYFAINTGNYAWYDEHKAVIYGEHVETVVDQYRSIIKSPVNARYVRLTRITDSTQKRYVSDEGFFYKPYGLDLGGSGSEGAKWTGKKVLVLGDSISDNSYHYQGNPEWDKWPYILENKKGFTLTNDSIKTTGFIAQWSSAVAGTDSLCNRITNYTEDEYDAVILFIGINDWLKEVPIGETISEDKTANFRSAVEYVLKYICTTMPSARLLGIIPLPTGNMHDYDAYSQILVDRYQYYNIPFLDLRKSGGFRPYIADFRTKFTEPGLDGVGDGLHPNQLWDNNYLAPMIGDFMDRFVL